jgi:Mce-associated membrane protein
MAEAKKPPEDSATSKADAMALIEEAEAEAAEAEALAAAARARARAARLRREAMAQAEAEAVAEAEAAAESESGTKAEAESGTKAEAESGTKAEAESGTKAEAEVETHAEEAEATEDEDDTATAEAADAESPGADAEAEETADESDESDESDEQASDETAEAAEPESRPAGWRRWVPSLSVTWKVAAIILIICFAGAIGYMAWQRHDATERQQRAARFVAGARQGIVNMTSLDFNKAKEDVQRVLDSSTGEFRDDFQQRAKDFTTVVEQSKVVTEGTVNAAALESMDTHSASVLVSATSKITNSAGAKDEPRAWRLRVTVTEDGGQYKMSKVDFIP